MLLSNNKMFRAFPFDGMAAIKRNVVFTKGNPA